MAATKCRHQITGTFSELWLCSPNLFNTHTHMGAHQPSCSPSGGISKGKASALHALLLLPTYPWGTLPPNTFMLTAVTTPCGGSEKHAGQQREDPAFHCFSIFTKTSCVTGLICTGHSHGAYVWFL